MDKLAKVKAEIERLRETNEVSEDKEYAQYELDVMGGYDMALDDMLSFINSLPEEPISEGKDIFDNCLKSEEKFILPQKISGNIDCENCLYSSACALGDIQACIIDKPVSEDLEEAMQHNAPNNIGIDDLLYWRNGFIAGAQWQKQQDQSTIELAEDHAMLAGMEKMKQQMMKDAVEASVNIYEEIGGEGYVEFVANVPIGKYKEKDVVKIITI